MAVEVAPGQARPGDVAELFREYFDSLLDHSEEMRRVLAHQNPEAELADMQSVYAPPHGRLLLADVDDEAVGCIALRRLSPDTGEVKRLYVRPAARGHRIASLLLERLLDEAREIGYHRVVLDSMAHMAPAIRLYERHGFHYIDAYNDAPSENVVHMELPLLDADQGG